MNGPDIRRLLALVHTLPPDRKEELARKAGAGELTVVERDELAAHVERAMVRALEAILPGFGHPGLP
jgi:hypothetical protein